MIALLARTLRTLADRYSLAHELDPPEPYVPPDPNATDLEEQTIRELEIRLVLARLHPPGRAAAGRSPVVIHQTTERPTPGWARKGLRVPCPCGRGHARTGFLPGPTGVRLAGSPPRVACFLGFRRPLERSSALTGCWAAADRREFESRGPASISLKPEGLHD